MTGLDPVTLRDARSELEASFVPGAGMLCSSLRHRGEELLAQNAGVAVYARDGATMGVPLLYPWANRLAEFDYTVAGKTVALPRDRARVALDDSGLPIHGVIGGRMAWEMSSLSGSGDCELTARMAWSEAQPELFNLFPFRHELTYTARLRAGQLEISVAVRATGTDAVPLAFGFHPYLTLPGVSRELCGGTHVGVTSEIGAFKIVSEGSSAANVRRVEVITGPEAINLLRGRDQALTEIATCLRVPPETAVEGVEALIQEKRELEAARREAGGEELGRRLAELVGRAQEFDGVKVVAAACGRRTRTSLAAVTDRRDRRTSQMRISNS